ncbi:NAD-dependent epimerase/dehydratase family protein [Candidatus Pelagibacter bacterium nBUS_49]|uniref:NAD-dependent epimerase/dehydratase family protein n=1 Tax=Candidatus Pelagibacter bacterium nBUS_49 TaxID=3374196 RepID=UPI003EBC1326
MKYLITGGAGFLGIKLVERLVKDNKNQIYIIDDLSKKSTNKIYLKILKNKKIKLIQKDLKDINKYLKIYNFDYIYHFAAILGVRKVIDDPLNTLRENILTSINLINFCKKQKNLKKICFTSTSEVYAYSLKNKMVKFPTPEEVDFLVSKDFNPRSSYSLSKIVGEHLMKYSKLNYIIFRPHNIFGPQMGFAHVIPQLTKKILNYNNRELVINNSNHKRTFCDINYAIELIFNISHKKNTSKNIFNIGSPEKDISIIELAKLIKRILNSSAKLIVSNLQKDNSPEKRRPNMKKSLKYIKFKHSFEKSLRETVLWYRDYYSK